MTGLIELKLNELNQLFNSMDPSPFHERDLDRNAEEFIVSWAREHPRQHELKLVIHLANAPSNGEDSRKRVADSVAHYFEYQAEMTWREFKRLMREGRTALLVGILFLIACQVTANVGLTSAGENWQELIREGLSIVGWVAMWRPLEIYLYRWWPLLSLRNLYRRLARMSVEVRVSDECPS